VERTALRDLHELPPLVRRCVLSDGAGIRRVGPQIPVGDQDGAIGVDLKGLGIERGRKEPSVGKDEQPSVDIQLRSEEQP
jgi:hypothetical protein